jgi:lysophospholipase L1-like esterase
MHLCTSGSMAFRRHCYIASASSLILLLMLALLMKLSPRSPVRASPRLPVRAITAYGKARSYTLAGPKKYYLALGDSLAFGMQPNGDTDHGYVQDFFMELHQDHGVASLIDYGCGGETSMAMISQPGCSTGRVHNPYTGTQLQAALAFIQAHYGQVSPVTLDIGADEMHITWDRNVCEFNTLAWDSQLAMLDKNLTQTILPALLQALHGTGDLILIDYYDVHNYASPPPPSNHAPSPCPDALIYSQQVNEHLAQDAAQFGIPFVDIWSAFNMNHICSLNTDQAYTWWCIWNPPNVHPTTLGYLIMADRIEETVGY